MTPSVFNKYAFERICEPFEKNKKGCAVVLEVIGISLLMLLASGFSAITGFGTSTLSIPLLLFFFSVPQTLLFVACIRFFGGLFKMIWFWNHQQHSGVSKKLFYRLLLMIGLPAMVASFLGAKTLLYYSDYISKQVLGGLLLAYVLFIFLKPHFTLSEKSLVCASGGAVAGFSGGLFGISGPVQTAFLSAFNLPKMTYIFTTAALDCMVDSSRLFVYLRDGISFIPLFIYSIICSIPAIFIGIWLARYVVRKIPQNYFRFVILGVLGIVALRWLIFG